MRRPFKKAKRSLLDAFERAYLQEMLSQTGGSLSATARRAELDRKHVRALLRKHGLWTLSEQEESEPAKTLRLVRLAVAAI